MASARNAATPQAQAAQRLASLRNLLDPHDLLPGHAVADLYSLRQLCLHPAGIPEGAAAGGIAHHHAWVPTSPARPSSHLEVNGASAAAHTWVRAQAWMVLLGVLPPEKAEWKQALDRRRSEYYQFVASLASSSSSSSTDSAHHHDAGLPGTSPERDALLEQIYRDLARSRRNAFAFYRAEVEPSWTCPLAPLPPEAAQGASARAAAPASAASPTSGAGEPEGAEAGVSDAARHAPRKAVERNHGRHALMRRLEQINADYAHAAAHEDREEAARASAGRAATGTGMRLDTSRLAPASTPPIELQPPTPVEAQVGDGSGGVNGVVSAHSDSVGSREAEAAAEVAPTPPPPPPPLPQKQGVLPERPPLKDRRWHSLLRILYVHALLNPSTGYVQGMGEVVWVLFYVLGTAATPNVAEPGAATAEMPPLSETTPTASVEVSDESELYRYISDPRDPPGAHAEADAFHLFQALLGEVRDVYDFEGIDHGAAGLRIRNRRATEETAESGAAAQRRPPRLKRSGMAGALLRFSWRLKWLDEDLWKALRDNSLDPRLPYYSFRWLACFLSTELALPSIVQVWDCLLAEGADARGGQDMVGSLQPASPRVEFLIDVCCALLITLRGPLLDALDGVSSPQARAGATWEDDAFARGMAVLQDVGDLEISPVIELACLFRQRRLAAPLTGDAPPEEDDASVETGPTLQEKARRTLANWSSSAAGANNPTSRWLNSLATRKESVGEGSRVVDAHSSSSPVGAESANGRASLTPTGTPQRVTSIGSGSSGSGMLQRYASALQSSDAAASLSKASTNLTAKALLSWNQSPLGRSSRESSPSTSGQPPMTTTATAHPATVDESPSASARMRHFVGMGSSLLRKPARSESVSSIGSAASLGHAVVHPAVRRHKDMPELPLPDVANDDPAREEYAYVRRRSVASSSAASMSPVPSRQGSVAGSPAVGGSFEGTPPPPTFSQASGWNTLPRSGGGVAGSSSRSNGPKPLLMAGAARPPREGSHAESLAAAPSRKVSRGPLAATAMMTAASAGAGAGGSAASSSSDEAARRRRRRSQRAVVSEDWRRGSSSSAASWSRTSQTPSEADSETTSAATSTSPSHQPTATSGADESNDHVDADAHTSHAAIENSGGGVAQRDEAAQRRAAVEEAEAAVDRLPPLPSLQVASSLGELTPRLPEAVVAGAPPPLGLFGNGQGTVPASAFAKVRAASSGVSGSSAGTAQDAARVSETGEEASELASDNQTMSSPSQTGLGHVESSSEVPLVSTEARTSTLRRGARRQASGSQNLAALSGSLRSQRDEQGNAEEATKMSVSGNGAGPSVLDTNGARPTDPADEGFAAFDSKADSLGLEQVASAHAPTSVQKYTLVDGPVAAPMTSHQEDPHRRDGSAAAMYEPLRYGEKDDDEAEAAGTSATRLTSVSPPNAGGGGSGRSSLKRSAGVQRSRRTYSSGTTKIRQGSTSSSASTTAGVTESVVDAQFSKRRGSGALRSSVTSVGSFASNGSIGIGGGEKVEGGFGPGGAFFEGVDEATSAGSGRLARDSSSSVDYATVGTQQQQRHRSSGRGRLSVDGLGGEQDGVVKLVSSPAQLHDASPRSSPFSSPPSLLPGVGTASTTTAKATPQGSDAAAATKLARDVGFDRGPDGEQDTKNVHQQVTPAPSPGQGAGTSLTAEELLRRLEVDDADDDGTGDEAG